jgi:hypothetical protein
MAKRGELYRCHISSFLISKVQTPGVQSQWTLNLEPIGDSELLSGTLVELRVRLEGPTLGLSPKSRVRLDILEEDVVIDDKVDSLVGPDASPPDSGFNALQRETEYVALGENESLGDFLDYLRRDRAPEYRDRLFLIEEYGDSPAFDILAFWQADRRSEAIGDSEFYFIVNVDEQFDDKTEKILNVTPETLSAPPPGAALEDRLVEPETDLVALREASDEVQKDFQNEEEAKQSGWQPPEPSTRPEPPIVPDPATATAARGQVTAAQLPPPPPPPIDTGPEAWPFPHPQGSVDQDQVKAGTSPFDGSVIAILRSWDTFRPTSERYAISFDFNRAIRWGQLLFGARAFAVIEGPIVGDNPPRYYTVRTNLLFALGAASLEAAEGGSGFIGVDVRYWQIEQRDPERNMYIVRLIGTTDNQVVIPNFPAHRNEFCMQLTGTPFDMDKGCSYDLQVVNASIPTDRAVSEVYADINQAINQGRNDDAARMLIELNWNAFALVSPERRGKFLAILLQYLTVARRTIASDVGNRTETAIREIVHSVNSPDELKQVVGELNGREEIRLIVGRMDNKLWSLLTDIGERLGKDVEIRIDFQFLLDLFQTGIGGNPAIIQPFRFQIRPDGSLHIELAGTDELYTAANTFLNFGKSFIEGFATLIFHPDKVAKGLWALIKGAVMIELARQGVPFALEWVNNELIPGVKRLARTIVNAWKGAQILADALGGEQGNRFLTDIVMRVKWAVVWEVASFFIGLGEVAAAVKTVGRAVEEVAGLLRLTRTVTAEERALGKLGDFANLAARSGISHADDATRILTHLPPEDLQPLTRALANVEPRNFSNLNQLAGRLDESGRRILNNIEDRMLALDSIDRRLPGTLATDSADAFGRLTNLPGATNPKLTQIFSSTGPLADREISNLLQTANALPPSALSGAGAVPFDTVRAISGRPGSFNALLRDGSDAVVGMLRQSGGDVRLMEKNFDALRVLRNQAPEADSAAVASRVLAGDRAALADLRNARHTLDVMKGRCLL